MVPFVRLDNLNLPSKLQKNLRLQRRKLPGSFEVASPSQTTEYLDALFELHESRWEGNGLLNADRIQAFHRRVVPGFAKRGWLRFHGIRIDGRLRAVLYAFAKGGRVYYYLSGFDPTLAEFGPGSYLSTKRCSTQLRRAIANSISFAVSSRISIDGEPKTV